MVKKCLMLLLVAAVSFSACNWNSSALIPVQSTEITATNKQLAMSVAPIKMDGDTFCTVFSINEEEGNWASAGHCALSAMEEFGETGMLPTIKGETAHIAYVDALYDVAVFQSDAKAPALQMSDRLSEVGDKVTIIGFPYGLTRVTVKGTVGARNIPIMHDSYGIYMRSDILDVTVAGGNSGSPVFDTDGKVVGVLWGKFSASSHSLSIPLESMRRALHGFWQ